jgi:hypothetical protein
MSFVILQILTASCQIPITVAERARDALKIKATMALIHKPDRNATSELKVGCSRSEMSEWSPVSTSTRSLVRAWFDRPRRPGRLSHHPLLAVLAEANFVLHAWLRSGNAGAGYKQPATLRFEIFTCGAILGRSGHHLVLHMSKNWGSYRLRPPETVAA